MSTRKVVLCTARNHDSQACSDARQSRNALSSTDAESHGIVRRLPGVASSWRPDLEKAVPVDQRTVDPGGTPQELVPAGVGGHDHEYDIETEVHTHVGATDIVAETDITTTGRGATMGVGVSHFDHD